MFVKDGTRIADLRRRILERYAGTRQIFVLTSEESRAYVLKLANEWFGLMDVQVAVAVLVALLGIVNALTVSITDRRRELYAAGRAPCAVRCGARSGSRRSPWRPSAWCLAAPWGR